MFSKRQKNCEECDTEKNYPEQRRKRVKRHDLSEGSGASYDITPQKSYKIQINEATELWAELETLKSQAEATTLFDKCECQSSLGLFKAIVKLDLKVKFPNVVVAIKIFLNDASDCSFLREII